MLGMHDDKILIVGAGGEVPVQLFDLEKQLIVQRPAASAVVWHLELNKLNDVLAYGEAEGSITLYDMGRHSVMHQLAYYRTPIRSLRWQTNSEHQFFVSTNDSAFHQWDMRRLDEPLRKVNVPTARSEGVFLRLQQTEHSTLFLLVVLVPIINAWPVIAGGGSNGMLYIYDSKTLALLYMIPASQHATNELVVDEFNVYMGFTNGSIRIFDFDVLPEHANVNPKTKVTRKSMHKLIGMHGYDYKGHVY